MSSSSGLTDAFSNSSLIPVAAVFFDPSPVRVLGLVRLDPLRRGKQPRSDVPVPDQTRRGDDARVEEVALHRGVEDVTRIGDVGRALRDGLELFSTDAVLFAVLNVRQGQDGLASSTTSS